ncbi:MAG TPA: hypothetical protein P5555_00365 [Candidatus Paceibacterota bacterium]|nr:hypothetical protein [Verrucomicrobiota bacterium]HRZ43624.1 hypothetical protein [Candidatus Paceibacterota bacterium]HRZ92771.1 hypothetical protein [Candidatus Paceibacterota bacterium]
MIRQAPVCGGQIGHGKGPALSRPLSLEAANRFRTREYRPSFVVPEKV